ncbi:anion permease [Aliarcobacter butzleri]|nr:anion permease [Aliarcobacter butzleri]
MLDYIGKNAQTALSDLHTTSLLIALIVLFFLLHYFFASVTAHVTLDFLK